MFKQLVGTLEVQIEDGIADVDVIEVAAKNDSAEEETVRGVNVSHDDRSKTWPRRVGDERPRMRVTFEDDSKAPPAIHVSRVHEDPSLVNRNKRMFRQLLGNSERFGKQDEELSVNEVYTDSLRKIEDGKNVDDIELKDDQYKDSAVEECVMGVGTSQNGRTATWLRNEVEPLINYSSAKSLGADVPLTEQQKEQAKEKAHEESEWLRQNTTEQIAENGRDLTVSTHVAAKDGKKDFKVDHNKLRRFLRTKAEPPIEYSFAISSDADVPSIEQQNEQKTYMSSQSLEF